MDYGSESYRRYREGDDEGFVEIVRRYCDGLTMYINGIVGDICLAEELADDALLKLAVKKPAFHGSSSFKTWLYSIGRNVALDHLRRGKNAQELPLDENIPSGSDPESSYIEDERKKQLYRAMQKLQPEYREALWLSYFEDMDASQIGALLHKSRNGVYMILSRAKDALKKELLKEGFIYEGQ